MAYLGFSKGGAKPGGLGDFRPPAGSGAEPKRPGYFSKGGGHGPSGPMVNTPLYTCMHGDET